jgi:Domain of unknown function (DUF4180)
MDGNSYEFHGVRIFECAADGDAPRGERDAARVVNHAFNHKAKFVVIPAARLGDEFFDLKTRIAGEFLQKFVTYQIRVAILGDISHYIASSAALRDYVRETNRGLSVWFVADRAELERRVIQISGGTTAQVS